MRRQKWDEQLDSLCSALDGIQTTSELEAFAREIGLVCAPLAGATWRLWKGQSMGASVEIVMAPSAASPEMWDMSVLVTSGPRVEHVRRRPLKL